MTARSVLVVMAGLLVLAIATSSAAETSDFATVALNFVRSTADYIENGGFGERVVDVGVNGTVAEVVVEYNTRHVGMLQVIGRYLCHVYLNSTTLKVIASKTETNYDTLPATGTAEENASSANSTNGPRDSYAGRISQGINQTREVISRYASEANFTAALSLVDLAEERLSEGRLDEAHDLLFRAEGFVHSIIEELNAEQGRSPAETP